MVPRTCDDTDLVIHPLPLTELAATLHERCYCRSSRWEVPRSKADKLCAIALVVYGAKQCLGTRRLTVIGYDEQMISVEPRRDDATLVPQGGLERVLLLRVEGLVDVDQGVNRFHGTSR
jgi:hypothetical protein